MNLILTSNIQSSLNIAICYFGLTRSTRQVYQSHHKNLFNILKRNCVSFEVFLHTWKTEHTWCWANELSIPNDYKEHKYLNPNYYQILHQESTDLC